MKLTKVNLFPASRPGLCKAYGSIELDNELVVKLNILEKDNGPWIAWDGSRKVPGVNGEKDKWVNPIFFKTETFSQSIKEEVISYYHNNVAGQAKRGTSSPKGGAMMEEDELPF